MKQTANYQLNQWEQTDRIQMADFNADNSRVDQALAGLQAAVSAEAAARQSAVSAEQAARQAALTALENKSRFTKLSEVSLSSNTESWEISLSGIDWTQWDRVHLDICLKGRASSVYLNVKPSTGGTLLAFGDSTSVALRRPRLSLDVGFQADRMVSGQCGGASFQSDTLYSGLTKFILSGIGVYAGSTAVIWGEK